MGRCNLPSAAHRSVYALLLSLVAASVAAQPLAREDVPPLLRPWIPWVLDQAPSLGCARVQGQAVCVWPGQLRLDLGASGGSFSLDAQADRPADLRLPGAAPLWPQDVRLDGAAAPVFDRDGTPRLRLGAGRHRVTGRFEWSHLPESLPVPAEVGLVSLRLDGAPVDRPRRDEAGLLWLRASGEAAGEGESLRLQVFRKVTDGLPLFVETRLELEVAGRAREVALPGALLPGTVPVAVSGDLPARVDGDTIRVQVRGGRYSVSVDARVEGRPAAIALPKERRPEPWPPREVWVFAADESLRQVELSGPVAIDPSRTELPPEWRTLPAFLLDPGGSLALKEVRRGETEPPPDALSLQRELWLDPDGRAASVRDRFAGTLRATTRLDLLAPGVLGRIAVDGQDQLVTARKDAATAGVELRRSALRMEADSRVPIGGPLPAVGWSAGVEQLGATLHVPPGWTLLFASGVDRVPGTWTARWNLLAFFFVLVVTLAVQRLFGRTAGLVALGALVLLHGEAGAPSVVWLGLVAGVALERTAPAGRLRRLARLLFLGSAAALVVVTVPFARDQVKDALFPQAGVGGGRSSSGLATAPASPARVGGVVGDVVNAPAAATAESAELDKMEEEKASVASRSALPLQQQAAPRKGYSYNVALEQDPKAVLQTGPGVPSWTWRSYTLAWSGPVGRDHRMRLVLASPWTNRLLTLLRLGLLAALAAILLRRRRPSWPRPAAGVAEGPAVAATVVLAALVAAPAPVRAQSDPPGNELLQELRQRLTRPAACEPHCVSTPGLVLRLGAGGLSLSAEVHAAADGSWPLPGPVASWIPADVRVDGVPAVAIARLSDGFLRLRLVRGVHRVEAAGPVPPGDSFTLQFAEPPRRARAEAPGWDVSGLRRDGPPEPSILLTRRLAARDGGRAVEGRYAPWLEVDRTLSFGVTWTVSTTVRRVTPRGAPIALRVPLLPGEAPTRADLVVEHGEVAVSLGGDETEASWESALEQSATIALSAPEGRPWSEVWRLACSPVWSCVATGLPPVARRSDGVFAPVYRPWPGESLSVALAHPQGVEGQTLTVDALTVEDTPGRRLERARLSATARSSREQPLVLGLPKEAEVQQVTLDGAERPSRPDAAGELRITVPAGSHTIEVRWQQAHGMGLVHRAPRVALSSPAVNVTQQVTVPPERWLLFTSGPSWGPAVLFWPYLAVVIVVAVLLGRAPASPLTTRQWVLLGLGLGILPAPAALVVVAFVFALAWRARRPPAGVWSFDGLQLLLGAWALVSLGILYVAVYQGLLVRPDMQVAGGGSSETLLRWYADRVGGPLPTATVVSLPLWAYRVAMLLWALWLAAALVAAAGPAWRALTEGGLWRPLPKPVRSSAKPAADAGSGAPRPPSAGASDEPRPRPASSDEGS